MIKEAYEQGVLIALTEAGVENPEEIKTAMMKNAGDNTAWTPGIAGLFGAGPAAIGGAWTAPEGQKWEGGLGSFGGGLGGGLLSFQGAKRLAKGIKNPTAKMLAELLPTSLGVGLGSAAGYRALVDE